MGFGHNLLQISDLMQSLVAGAEPGVASFKAREKKCKKDEKSACAPPSVR